MSTLASLVVDLQVQSAQLKAGLDEANKKLDDFAKGASKIGDALKGLFTFEVAKAGLRKLEEFVQEGVQALAEEEKSAGRLAAAFTALGYDAQKVAPYFNDLAESLEHELLVDGETVRQVEQLLVQFGVAPREIEKTTRAILDYSAATGKNAVAAAQQLTTSILSGHDEIRKMGISIQSTGDATKDLSAAVEQMTDHFGGSAAGATQNLAGQLGRLQMAQEDLGKAFAKFFVDSDIGKRVIQALTEAMDGMTYALSKEAAEQAASVARTEQLTKLREELEKVERRIATEKERIAEGSFLASQGSLVAAQQERNALQARLDQVMALRREAQHAQEAEAQRAQDAAKAAEAEASAKAKSVQDDERRKKAEEAAAAAAKKAAEERLAMFKRLAAEAQRWAEAQAKAAAQFERAKADVGRGVEDRQRVFAAAGMPGAGPDTRGFSSFDAAVAELRRAAEEEAALRERAAMAEVDGKLELQGQLEALADQAKATAENAGKAADAFTSLKKASVDAQMAMEQTAHAAQQSMLAKALGPVQGLVDAGKQGAAAGAMLGPEGAAIGAVAGVGLELLTQSAEFKRLTDQVGWTIQALADALGGLLEPLLPFAALVEMFAEALSSILVPIFKALEPPFRVLFDVVKGFMLLVLNVEKVIIDVINGIAHFFGLKGLDDTGLKAGIDKLSKATFDTAEHTVRLGKAAKEATEEILNAPQGFKGLALAKWSAADMDMGPSGAGGGGAGGAGGGVFPGLGDSGSGAGGGAFGGGGSSGGGRGGGAGSGRRMNLTGSSGDGPVVEVHVNADLERYVSVESRQKSYSRSGSTLPMAVAFDY